MGVARRCPDRGRKMTSLTGWLRLLIEARPKLMSTRRTHLPVSLVVAPDRRDTSDARARPRPEGGAAPGRSRRPGTASRRPSSCSRQRALGSESEAEDVAQEVFHRVFAKARTLREPERLRSFVFSFAIRLLKTELRRRRTRAWLSFHRPETLVDLGGELDGHGVARSAAQVLCAARSAGAAASAGVRASPSRVHDGGGGRRPHGAVDLDGEARAGRATSKLSLWMEADPGLAGFLDEKGCLR